MSLEVQIDCDSGRELSIAAAGEYSLADLQHLFDRVKEESEKCGCRKVRLDVTRVAGTIPVVDMLVLGEHCARHWQQAFRIAIISAKEGFSRFFENVGRNRGVQIAVVSDHVAAVDWLK